MEDDLLYGYELVASQSLLVSSITIMFGPVIVWSETRDFSFNDLECTRYMGDSLLLFDNFCGKSLEEYDQLVGKGNLLFIGKMIFARKLVITLHSFSLINWILTWIYPRLQFARVTTLWVQQFMAIALLVNLESFLQSDDYTTYPFDGLRARNVNYGCSVFTFAMTTFLIGLYFYRYRRYGNIYK